MSSPIRCIEDDDDEPFDRVPSWLSVRRQVAKSPSVPYMSEPAFSGDRALMELRRRLSRAADIDLEPPLEAYGQSADQRPMVWRFLSLVGVAAVVAGGIVLLPSLRKNVTAISQTDVQGVPTEASQVKLVDAQGTTEASPLAQYGSAAVNQPRVVAAMPLADPPAEGVQADPSSNPSAATPSSGPAAKSVASPALKSLPEEALTSSAVATTPSPSQSTSASPASTGSPSSQAPTVLTAPAMTSASPVPVSGSSARALAQVAPASPQGDVSATPAPQPSSASVGNRTVPTLDVGEVTMLLSRGRNFLSAGDLSSSQLLFRRAAEAGSAEAALALASTYDPRYLAAHKVVGVVGDEVKARAWYQRAAELGSLEATRILAQLGAK